MPADRDPATLTALLQRASEGHREAFDQLLPVVYDELKVLARHRLRFERPGHTLNTTALVHETYLKLIQQDRVQWQSRAHFFAVAAQAMRRILVDYARARKADRRGGGAPLLSVDALGDVAAGLFTEQSAADLLTLNGALDDLGRFDRRAARVVECRFFGGLAHSEIALILGVSEITVRRSWTSARAWLRRELGDEVSQRSRAFLAPPGNTGDGDGT